MTTQEIQNEYEFMQRLREAFPPKEKYGFDNDVKCHVTDIVRELNMDYDEVWKHIGICIQLGFVDNNGGSLRFNDTLEEDIREILFLCLVREAEKNFLSDYPIGFTYKILRNIYRDNNFCAGKYTDIKRNETLSNDLKEWFLKFSKEQKGA